MTGFPSDQVIAAIAGFASGAVLGAGIWTETEMLKRGFVPSPFNPWARVRLGYLLYGILYTLLSALVWFAVGFTILRLGGISHLDRVTSLPFVTAMFVGMAAGKFARYMFWRMR